MINLPLLKKNNSLRFLFILLFIVSLTARGQYNSLPKTKIITNLFPNGCHFNDSLSVNINDTIAINFFSLHLNNVHLSLVFKDKDSANNFDLFNLNNTGLDSFYVHIQLEINNNDSLEGEIQTYFGLSTGVQINRYSEGTEHLQAYHCNENRQILIRCVVIPYLANIQPRELFQVIIKNK